MIKPIYLCKWLNVLFIPKFSCKTIVRRTIDSKKLVAPKKMSLHNNRPWFLYIWPRFLSFKSAHSYAVNAYKIRCLKSYANYLFLQRNHCPTTLFALWFKFHTLHLPVAVSLTYIIIGRTIFQNSFMLTSWTNYAD